MMSIIEMPQLVIKRLVTQVTDDSYVHTITFQLQRYDLLLAREPTIWTSAKFTLSDDDSPNAAKSEWSLSADNVDDPNEIKINLSLDKKLASTNDEQTRAEQVIGKLASFTILQDQNKCTTVEPDRAFFAFKQGQIRSLLMNVKSFVVTGSALQIGFPLAADHCDDHYQELSSNFTKLLEDRKLTDVVIVTEDGEKFPLHRAVLAARSEAICAMCDTDVLKNKEVQIPGINGTTMSIIVNYLYSGNVRALNCVTREELEVLVAASDVLSLDMLKKASENILIRCLTADSVVNTLALAENCSCSRLRAAAIAFVSSNKTAVFRRHGWADEARLSSITNSSQPSIQSMQFNESRGIADSTNDVKSITDFTQDNRHRSEWFYSEPDPNWNVNVCAFYDFDQDSIHPSYKVFEHTVITDDLHPQDLRNVAGDGNCLFRCISYWLTGSERQHYKIRQTIVNEILSFEDPTELLDNNNGREYVTRTKMDRPGSYGTEVEIEVAASIFNVTIAVFDDQYKLWQKHPYLSNQPSTASTIFILHKRSQQHYMVILSLQTKADVGVDEVVSLQHGVN